MAALKEEQRYGLSCGRVNGGSNVSVFHVKLTDSALRAFESYQRNRTLSAQPSIRFAGSQGNISVPQCGNPGEPQEFSFYLSNVAKDNPQGSFDCVQQYISSLGHVQLDCVAGIRHKITVRASDDSYQKAKQSMTQAKEETRDRGAIVIKPGTRYMGKKVHIRKPPAPSLCDVVPCRQTSRPVIISSALKKGDGAGQVQLRPLRDRVVHLLALKTYSRPEMVVRLQKDGLVAQDRHSLDGLLHQVADLNTRDGLFTLKDCLFVEVQKDWPGYTEVDQQLLKKINVRKMSQSQSASLAAGDHSSSTQVDHVESVPPQKRSGITDFVDPLANKKPRISHLTVRTLLPVNSRPSSGRDAGVAQGGASLTFSRPSDPPRDVTQDLVHNRRQQGGHSGQSSRVTERLGQPALHTGLVARPPPACGSAPLPPSQPGLAGAPPEPSPAPTPLHAKSKRKSRKHKDKEKEKCKSQGKEKEVPKEGQEPGAGSELSDQSGAYSRPNAVSSTLKKADYLLNYPVICSQEQRQRYKDDFNVEYNEYRNLHARIEGVTRQFTVLDSQLRQLQPGSDKYKTIHNQILQEYHKIKKTNPNYTAEKSRCESLHSKLAHIKKLIAEFDQQQQQGWC